MTPEFLSRRRALMLLGSIPAITPSARSGADSLDGDPGREAAGAVLVEVLSVPLSPGADAIWGATGQDAEGGLWFGVSAKHPGDSARLWHFRPADARWRDAGAVNDRLGEAGVRRSGEGQVKMHSRIVPGGDGRLYFTSMDEEGEREDGSALPRWGSHLWCIDPASLAWQHLAAFPEALIALGAGAGKVFALGYWNHVLVRYDTRSGAIARTTVGSPGGHISRNLLADARGHAFVPRVTSDGADAWLAEFDGELREVGATPLPGYATPGDAAANHGITGLATHPDGRSWFTTHTGRLFAIVPRQGGAARVHPLGHFHPAGERYSPSLFLIRDGRTLAGAVKAGTGFDWVERDLHSGKVTVRPMDLGNLQGVLLYGSMTRDTAGRCYLAGRADEAGGGHRPIVVRVAPAR